MVARTRPEGELLVIFSRIGERDEAIVVPNPERAYTTAIVMLAQQGELFPGDQLVVQNYDGEEDAA
jgi:hypothetical protein